jgi:hypothetical protein
MEKKKKGRSLRRREERRWEARVFIAKRMLLAVDHG